MDGSVDGKIKAKVFSSQESSGTLLGRLPLKVCSVLQIYSKYQMLSIELSSCCSCDVFRQYFAVKRVKCSAIVRPFCSNYQNNSTSSSGFLGQRFNNLQPGCTFDVILTSSVQYDKILFKFGQQQLVMVN